MFPYIRQIKVNDCFAYQNFSIPNSGAGDFKHIILTGKNGSGKTTILNGINKWLQSLIFGEHPKKWYENSALYILENNNRADWDEIITELKSIDLDFDIEDIDVLEHYFIDEKDNFIFSFFKSHRKAKLDLVQTVTKETALLDKLNKSSDSESFTQQFKQYLVNKKVFEAFEYMKSQTDSSGQNKIFFDKFTDSLRSVFQDDKLELEFAQEEFDFYLRLKDGQRITFNQLSEGFSAFVTILMDLFMRTDLIRKQNSDYTLDPCGIVLIDEPETHLHIEMQYEILPMLDTLFPNIQMIIATHSPAIISSLENALVYDLTTKKEVTGSVVGSSFSELMTSHFGLKNEFSPSVDKLLLELDHALQERDFEKLDEMLIANEPILTPSLRLEIETRIIELKEAVDD